MRLLSCQPLEIWVLLGMFFETQVSIEAKPRIL